MSTNGAEPVPELGNAGGGVDTSLLPALVTNLAEGIQKLYQFLEERQTEAEALRRDLDRIGTRQEEMAGTLRALEMLGGGIAADVEELQRTRASFAAGLADIEQWLRQRPQQAESATTLNRVGNLEKQVEALREQLETSTGALRHADESDATNARIQTVLQALSKRQDELQIVLGQLIRRGAEERRTLPASEDEGQEPAAAPVADLIRRVEILEHQEMAVSRIIDLLVERSRLIGEDDAGAGHGSG